MAKSHRRGNILSIADNHLRCICNCHAVALLSNIRIISLRFVCLQFNQYHSFTLVSHICTAFALGWANDHLGSRTPKIKVLICSDYPICQRTIVFVAVVRFQRTSRGIRLCYTAFFLEDFLRFLFNFLLCTNLGISHPYVKVWLA